MAFVQVTLTKKYGEPIEKSDEYACWKLEDEITTTIELLCSGSSVIVKYWNDSLIKEIRKEKEPKTNGI